MGFDMLGLWEGFSLGEKVGHDKLGFEDEGNAVIVCDGFPLGFSDGFAVGLADG